MARLQRCFRCGYRLELPLLPRAQEIMNFMPLKYDEIKKEDLWTKKT